MKDDKKKLAIVGVLGFIVVGVGAFEFLGSNSSSPIAPKKASKPAVAADKKEDKGPKNPEFAANLPERDPFKAPAGEAPPGPQSKPTLPQARAPRASQPRSLSGNIASEGVLPPIGGNTAPLAVVPEKPGFGYRLSGLISGHHPAAVFTDSSGAQRLVPLNGSLDGDTQLVAVEKGRAVVSFRGKHLKLSLGGTPVGN